MPLCPNKFTNLYLIKVMGTIQCALLMGQSSLNHIPTYNFLEFLDSSDQADIDI